MSLFQPNLRKQIRKWPKILKIVKVQKCVLFLSIHSYSFVISYPFLSFRWLTAGAPGRTRTAARSSRSARPTTSGLTSPASRTPGTTGRARVSARWASNKRLEISKFEFNFPRARTYELIRARSRLYRSQILQVNTRWN